MRANIGRTIQSVLLVAVLIIVLPMTGCRKETRPHISPKAAGRDDNQGLFGSSKGDSLKASFKKARITWNDAKGNRVWDAQFKEAIASQTGSTSSVELRGVEADLYEGGKLVSKLIAPNVTADSKQKEVKATGGVELVSSADGAVVHADSLRWRSAEGKVYGVGNIEMTRKNISVAAVKFEADTGLKKAIFKNGRIEVE